MRHDELGFSRDRARDRLEQVEALELDDLASGSDQGAIVRRAPDRIRGHLDLHVEIDDELLRLLLLSRVRAVMPRCRDAGEEQTRCGHGVSLPLPAAGDPA
jgi:hypothetical protein